MRKRFHFSLLLIICLAVIGLGCAGSRPPARRAPTYGGRTGGTQYGIASWYGRDFHGRKTASGEIYNMRAFTAAHKTLPFGTYVRVTNLKNGRRTIVRINDRGPFIKGRIIDLSYSAAREIDMVEVGIQKVRLDILPV